MRVSKHHNRNCADLQILLRHHIFCWWSDANEWAAGHQDCAPQIRAGDKLFPRHVEPLQIGSMNTEPVRAAIGSLSEGRR
jgi:hypothetical protein